MQDEDNQGTMTTSSGPFSPVNIPIIQLLCHMCYCLSWNSNYHSKFLTSDLFFSFRRWNYRYEVVTRWGALQHRVISSTPVRFLLFPFALLRCARKIPHSSQVPEHWVLFVFCFKKHHKSSWSLNKTPLNPPKYDIKAGGMMRIQLNSVLMALSGYFLVFCWSCFRCEVPSLWVLKTSAICEDVLKKEKVWKAQTPLGAALVLCWPDGPAKRETSLP